MPLVVPGICRFTVNQLLSGRPVANVLDYQIDTTGSPTSRADAIEAMAGIIINEWSDQFLTMQTADLSARSVSWVDLDSLTGTTGSRNVTSQETWPQVGVLAGDALPNQVSCLIRKEVTSDRSTRNGRMYLAGIGTGFISAADSSQVGAATVTLLNTKLAAFLGDTNQTGLISGDYDSRLCVVHTPASSAPSFSFVEALVTDPTFATQMRRLRD